MTAERANLAKATFLAHMSHELRTPLSGVIGMTQLALRGEASETQRRYLRLVEESGHTLLRILNDVLDFAKAEAGKLKLVAEPFDLPRLVVETVRSLAPQVDLRPIHLLFDQVGEITHVVGDAGRVRQIVSNLVGNALKFTERGSVEVVLAIRERSAATCAAHITVSDSGPGMDGATLARVFDAFEQGESGLARRHGGTGLGLTIVRQLAELMGGRIDVSSEPGKGSVFSVELVLGAAEQPAVPAPAEPPGCAWLLYADPVPASWLERRLDAIGWRSEIVADVGSLEQRLRDADPPPDCMVVPERLLSDAALLPLLRRVSRRAVPMSVMLRPDSRLPALGEGHALPGAHLAFAPLTRSDLERLVRPPAAPPPAEEASMPMPLGTSAPLVLVVEDTEMNRLIVVEMLRLLGMEVRVATSGEEALAACQREVPDLVLMDIQMPGMDGLEATQRLRALQHSGSLPHFPIVALTANALESDRVASRTAGLDEHIAKPVELKQLRVVLTRWLPEFGLRA